jgi:FO synthase
MQDPLTDDEALWYANASAAEVRDLCRRAAEVRDAAWGKRLTYSPKVFLPVTNLCRNRCEYCAFRRSPNEPGAWTMTPGQIEESLQRARRQACVEALFCLGDTPETAFPTYRDALAELGHESTVAYLEWAGRRALDIGLLPHTNAGILSSEAMQRLKAVNVSLGLMLENVSARLCQKGMVHGRAPDKRPERRLAMLNAAGELRIPFTTGILIGIGETRRERIEALVAIRDVHERHGHIQEVIVQNFTPHAGTRMADTPEPSDEEMAHAVALARLILPADVSVQAPPNLNAARMRLLLGAGINDFGGISPVTPDYINPDRPWPVIAALGEIVGTLGFQLAPRLPIYDAFRDNPEFLHPALAEYVVAAAPPAGARVA